MNIYRKDVVMGIKNFASVIEGHMKTFGPLYVAMGIAEKSGEGYKASAKTSKAGANFMGIGKDDEAIISSVLGKMINGKPPLKTEATIVLKWYSTLQNHQKLGFRLTIAQIFEEFKNFDDKKNESYGMQNAIGVFQMFADLSNDAERTSAAIALNYFSTDPPIYQKIWDSAKTIDLNQAKNKFDQDLSDFSQELLR